MQHAVLAIFMLSLPAASGDPLTKLAQHYGTDKASHGFTKFYHKIFHSQRLQMWSMMEIGVFAGSSIKMWRDYLANATIVGIDNFMCGLRSDQKTAALRAAGGNKGCLSKELAEAGRTFRDEVTRGEHGPRVRLFTANQSDQYGEMKRVLHELKADGRVPFDLIVEDGSHKHSDQQMNLAVLFPLVRPGGFYVLEDIHSSFQRAYDEPPNGYNTTYHVISRFNQTGAMRSKHMTSRQEVYLERWIDYAYSQVTRSYRNDQTCLIRKRIEPREGVRRRKSEQQ